MRDAELAIILKVGVNKHRFVIPVTLGEPLHASIECNLNIIESEEDNAVEGLESARTPGMALNRLRRAERYTQKQLADRIGIRQHHLSEMENGKRPIGKEMAKKLANVLNANWRILV